MYDNFFSNLPHDEDTASLQEVQALKDFLGGKTTAQVAAREYTTETAKQQQPEATKLWALLCDAALQVPEAQSKLVEILAAVKSLDGTTFKSTTGKLEFWADLPGFVSDMSDSRRGLCASFEGGSLEAEGPSAIYKYTVLMAFAAQLTASQVVNLNLWAMEDLHSALEKDHSATPEMYNEFVPAAVEWILLAGSHLYQSNDKYPDPNEDVRRSMDERSLWKGELSFSKERWDFWRQRLSTIANSSGVTEQTRNAASRALEAMKAM